MAWLFLDNNLSPVRRQAFIWTNYFLLGIQWNLTPEMIIFIPENEL